MLNVYGRMVAILVNEKYKNIHLKLFWTASLSYICDSNDHSVCVLLTFNGFMTKRHSWLGKTYQLTAFINFENTGFPNKGWWC